MDNGDGKLLRLKASDIAKTISEKLLEPISGFIAHYEESFTAEVDMLIQTMEAGKLLRAKGPDALQAKIQHLQLAATSLDKAADDVCRCILKYCALNQKNITRELIPRSYAELNCS